MQNRVFMAPQLIIIPYLSGAFLGPAATPHNSLKLARRWHATLAH